MTAKTAKQTPVPAPEPEQGPRVEINGKSYNPEAFTNEQKKMLGHCLNLQQRIAAVSADLEVLQAAQEYFNSRLSGSLAALPTPRAKARAGKK